MIDLEAIEKRNERAVAVSAPCRKPSSDAGDCICDIHRVADIDALIAEVRRLKGRYEPECCPNTGSGNSAHACGCHWPGNHTAP